MKYKGNYVDFQRVRAKKKPKIDIVGEQQNTDYKPEDAKAAAETLRREAMNQGASGPVAPEWTLQVISHDDDILEFDGFNLNYNEAKGALFTFTLPMLITGKPNLT